MLRTILAILLSVPLLAAAQPYPLTYPSRPIRLIVTYPPGGGPALTDVMGGQVPVFFANMASGLPHVKSGKLKALAVTSARRSASAPEVRHRISALGGEIVASTPGDTAAWLREQTASWGKVVREGNIRVE